jgi:hypothetical protein
MTAQQKLILLPLGMKIDGFVKSQRAKMGSEIS